MRRAGTCWFRNNALPSLVHLENFERILSLQKNHTFISNEGLKTWSCVETGLETRSGLEILVSVLCSKGLGLAQGNLPRPLRPQKF